MNKSIKISSSLVVPEKPGLYVRIICMTGKNKGLSYYLKGQRAVMGRSDKVDIQVLDTKSSREHAEIVKSGSGYILTDLGSQNGIIVNELKVKQHNLENNDRIVIGKTVFKFAVKEVKELVTVDEEDEYEDDDEEEERLDKKGSSKKKKDKKIIYIVLILGVLVFMLDPDEKPKTKKKVIKSLNDVTEDFTSEYRNKMSARDKEVRGKLVAIIHRGLREFRERNYFRAIHEFELALMLSPGNARAAFYLDKTKQAMDEEIEKNFIKAKRDTSSLKYAGAIVSYCAIVKLLEGYPDDERYKSAEENIRYVEGKMGLDKGEITCN